MDVPGMRVVTCECGQMLIFMERNETTELTARLFEQDAGHVQVIFSEPHWAVCQRCGRVFETSSMTTLDVDPTPYRRCVAEYGVAVD